MEKVINGGVMELADNVHLDCTVIRRARSSRVTATTRFIP